MYLYISKARTLKYRFIYSVLSTGTTGSDARLRDFMKIFECLFQVFFKTVASRFTLESASRLFISF